MQWRGIVDPFRNVVLGTLTAAAPTAGGSVVKSVGVVPTNAHVVADGDAVTGRVSRGRLGRAVLDVSTTLG